MIPLTHQNKSDHAYATLGAGALQPTVLAGRFGIAEVLPRKSCRGSLVPVRRAREYDRNAIFVAAGTSGWIFSYHARPRSGAACGAGFSRAAGPGAAGLRHISEQSVQMRSVDQAAGETASHCQK